MFEIVDTLSQSRLNAMINIAKTVQMKEDVSSYARGRQRAWLNMHWDLKNRKFDTNDCFRDPKLWKFIKEVWPDAEIGLLTYSGLENPKGISLHRDDSYADYESYGIQLTGTCDFYYMGGYRNFKWEQDRDIEVKKLYSLKPGDIFRFNCKNRHSAVPSVDRYAINLWKVSPKFKNEYKEAIQSTIKPLF